MAKETRLGVNRTGMQMSPRDSNELLQGSQRAVPTSEGDEGALARIRADYVREGERPGSVPLPGTLKGAVKTGMDALTGSRTQVLLDKLGERLAFERAGTRLYQALIIKCLATPAAQSVIEMDLLEEIHNEEARHFELLHEAIESLGADPTAQTPCADLTGVQSLGLVQAL